MKEIDGKIDYEGHIDSWLGLFSGFISDAERAGEEPKNHNIQLSAVIGTKTQRRNVIINITPAISSLYRGSNLGFDTLKFEVIGNGQVQYFARGIYVYTDFYRRKLLQMEYEIGPEAITRRLVSTFGAYLEHPSEFCPNE